MKIIKYLTTQITFLLFCLIPIFSSYKVVAQDWNYHMGLNSSRFTYQSPSGIDLNAFQPDAGLHLSISRNAALIDSSKTKSRFLRRLAFQTGLSINQFNSLGENQFIPFSYSSTYTGIKLGIGMKSKISRGLHFHYGAILQVNKLVLGSQKTGNLVYNLLGNNQFDQIQWQVGGELKIVKKVTSQTALFVFITNVWQINKTQNDGSRFAINPTTFGFGIQYSTTK
jgi:hypothetical protein